MTEEVFKRRRDIPIKITNPEEKLELMGRYDFKQKNATKEMASLMEHMKRQWDSEKQAEMTVVLYLTTKR